MLPDASFPATPTGNSGGDFGDVVRQMREYAGLSLRALAAAVRCDPGYLSRLEHGHRRASPAMVAALDAALNAGGQLVAMARAEDDGMRRRTVLTGTSAIVGALMAPVPLIADGKVVIELDRLLFDPTASADPTPVPAAQLQATIGTLREDFEKVRYAQLARRLPGLIRAAEATRDAVDARERPDINTLVAAAYGLATRLAIKLHEQGLAWSMVDRAIHAARNCGDPRSLAVAHRTAAVVLRRSGHSGEAQRTIVAAAIQLRSDSGADDKAVNSLYASMLATAGYTAALADRRDDAWALADEAAGALERPADPGFGRNDLELYRSGIARVLGDYGQAVDHARKVRLDLLRTPERRARYWEDVALAWMGRGRPQEAWEALREAEAVAPQEVLYRPWAQQLTRGLLTYDVRVSLSGLREFAARVGVE